MAMHSHVNVREAPLGPDGMRRYVTALAIHNVVLNFIFDGRKHMFRFLDSRDHIVAYRCPPPEQIFDFVVAHKLKANVLNIHIILDSECGKHPLEYEVACPIKATFPLWELK